MSDALNLLHRHLNGEALSEEERAALSDWVCASPENAKLVAELTCMDQTLSANLRSDASTPLMGLDESERADDTLPEYRQLADAAFENPPIRIESDALTKKKIIYALAYVVESTFTPKRLAYAAIAAVLLIAGAVLISQIDLGQPEQDIVQGPDEIEVTDQAVAVATLTAQHNAVWDQQPGEDLHPGDRLTLTAGFAEITTNRGAIAILEAPCEIELTKNNNALRLHTGKLVGICETDATKGFVVRTQHMDITDLGTRFGVAVQGKGNTLAEVFEGKVVATSYVKRSAETATVELSRGESRVVDAAGQVADRDLFPAEVFASVPRADSGIAVLFGDADLAPRPIADSDTAAAIAKRVTLYQELRGHRLASAIGLTFAEPGQHNDFTQTRSSAPAGTVIRTYILWHAGNSVNILSKGSVTFNGEILGAIGNERDWQAFVDATPSDAGQVCGSGRHAGLESVPAGSDKPNEQFTLSNDRKTLQFQFRSGPTDALRVIVREPVGDQP